METPALEPATPAAPSLADAPTAATDAAAPQPTPAEPQAIQVEVRSKSAARRMEESAQAVQVIELKQARVENADLGTVMARAPGVSLRRAGGLGSDTRFSINGTQGDQVRFFLDGIPLEYLGYTFGIANLPVNLVSRVEVYSGVVPIRFGADALGGAVNLVSDETLGKTGTSLSYQYGSFGTHRATALAQHADKDSGLFVRVEAFRDAAKNDYKVDVLMPDDEGREHERTVRRFHDAYQAQGVAVEAGVQGLPWASRLSLRGFAAGHQKDIQSDRVMTVPFGEAESQDSSAGLLLRYGVSFGEDWTLSTQTGYNQLDTRFIDLASCVYNWLGECVRKRQTLGELGSYASRNGADQRTYQHVTFNRSLLSFHASDWLLLSVSIAATYVSQTGEDVRITDPALRDPLKDARSIFTMVNGFEGRIDLFENRLQAISFAKQYFQALDTVAGQAGETIRDISRHNHHFGVGALLRYRISDWLLAKASYEWATRLPEAVELLGDNAGILANPDLKPERSHNFNLGTALHADHTDSGSWSLSVAGFLRHLDDLILLLPNTFSRFSQYGNVYTTRATGVIADVRWSSPGDYVSLSGNITSQRHIVVGTGGPFGYLDGKRLPNRPSLYGNATLGFQFSNVFRANDRVFSNQYLNWVDAFYRGWADVGSDENKLTLPTQLTLQMSLGYQQRHSWGSWSASVEMQNVTNAEVFDFYGSQKPGRALYAKITGELN